MLRPFLRPETAFFFAAWLVVLGWFRASGFGDPGALWHPVVGNLILDHGFMHTDPFTYTFAGEFWIPQQWGAEVLLAGAGRVGGRDTQLLGFATLLAGLGAFLFARLRLGGMAPGVAAVAAAGWLVVGGYHYYVRPHMATVALMAWTMAVVVDYDRGRASRWRLAGLVPIYIVWTNLHGGVLGGVFTLGLAVAGWVVGWHRASRRDGPVLVLILGACALTPLVNPFGLDMLRTWGRIVGSAAMPEMVSEHMPVDRTNPLGRMLIGAGVVYAVLVAGTLPRTRLVWWLPLVWFALTLKGVRQGPLFAVTAAVALADFWADTFWFRLMRRTGDGLATLPAAEPRPSGPGWRALTLPAAAVLVALGLQAAGIVVPVIGHGWARLDPADVPVDLSDAVHDYQRRAGPGARIFNDVNLGGYLISEAPGLRIYGDDRFELGGDPWLRQYQDLLYEHPERVDALADGWGFSAALLVLPPEGPGPLYDHLKQGKRWREVARGKRAVLFERSAGPIP